MAKERSELARRLTAQDWVDAALEAIAEGGLEALAVEPLAERLDVTKGSFYWHFGSRDALLEAVLARWEEIGFTAVVADLEAIAVPSERLRALAERAIAESRLGQLEVAFGARLDDPWIAATYRRLLARRLNYLVELFSELGLAKAQARRRALLAYATYAGLYQTFRIDPELVPRARAVPSFAREFAAMLAAEPAG